MIPIKILCRCGQKYAFDVEPVAGRMPHTVNCPVCGADGTAAANEIIARSLPPPRPAGLGINRPAATHATAAPPIPTCTDDAPKKKRGVRLPVLVVGSVTLLAVGGLLAWKFLGRADKLAVLPAGNLPKAAANPPKEIAGAAPTAQSAADAPANYLKGIKEQISLPPEITAFIGFKEQLANDLAQQDGFEVDADFKNFFTAAKAGHAREAEQFLLAIKKNSYGTNLTPALKSPLPQIAVDVALAYEAFDKADADMVLAMGNDLMNSLPAGCIYFGGTDPGRGLPTLWCKAPGDPVFVFSQNPLADGRYRQYLREMYGTRIQIPTTNEFQGIIDFYLADAQHRWQHDQDFPKEPKQLRPGENVRMVNGKPHLDGMAVMRLNALLAKAVFDKNSDREFYYEESAPLDWMYPYLSPHGMVMKINRQPLPAIPADDLQSDAAYWMAKVAQLKGNPKFKGDDYVGQTYAHLRSSIAGLYAWRAQAAKAANERERMVAAATNAFRQALTLDAILPEAVYGMVNLDMMEGRPDAALAVAKDALATDPSDKQMIGLIAGLKSHLKRQAPASAAANTEPNPDPQQQLKQLKDDLDQGKIDKATYDQKKSAILNSL